MTGGLGRSDRVLASSAHVASRGGTRRGGARAEPDLSPPGRVLELRAVLGRLGDPRVRVPTPACPHGQPLGPDVLRALAGRDRDDAGGRPSPATSVVADQRAGIARVPGARIDRARRAADVAGARHVRGRRRRQRTDRRVSQRRGAAGGVAVAATRAPVAPRELRARGGHRGSRGRSPQDRRSGSPARARGVRPRAARDRRLERAPSGRRAGRRRCGGAPVRLGAATEPCALDPGAHGPLLLPRGGIDGHLVRSLPSRAARRVRGRGGGGVRRVRGSALRRPALRREGPLRTRRASHRSSSQGSVAGSAGRSPCSPTPRRSSRPPSC